MEKAFFLKAQGWDFEKLIEKTAHIFNVDQSLIRSGSKHPNCVKARSVAVYWAKYYLDMNATEMSRELGLSKSAVSRSVERGRILVAEKALNIGS